MKPTKLGDIITFPIGVILFVSVSATCLASYLLLRIIGPRCKKTNNENND